mgnify:CR=1 FL=1
MPGSLERITTTDPVIMFENFCDKDHYIFTGERCSQLPLDIIIFILFEIFIANQARQS